MLTWCPCYDEVFLADCLSTADHTEDCPRECDKHTDCVRADGVQGKCVHHDCGNCRCEYPQGIDLYVHVRTGLNSKHFHYILRIIFNTQHIFDAKMTKYAECCWGVFEKGVVRHHETETLSVLLALCVGSPVTTGGIPSHMRSFSSFSNFLNCSRRAVEQIYELRGISDVMTIMWRHCNIIPPLLLHYLKTIQQSFWSLYPNIPRELGQYHGCWCSGSWRRQSISSHGIDYVELRRPWLPRGRISCSYSDIWIPKICSPRYVWR